MQKRLDYSIARRKRARFSNQRRFALWGGTVERLARWLDGFTPAPLHRAPFCFEVAPMRRRQRKSARQLIAKQRIALKLVKAEAKRFQGVTEAQGRHLPGWRAWKWPLLPGQEVPPRFYRGEFKRPKVLYSPQRGNAYIYALRDPVTLRVKYIGKAYDPHKRYDQHLTKSSYAVNAWVKAVRHKGQNPDLKILEQVAYIYWQERERYWIWFFRHFLELLNVTDGGDTYA